MRPLFNAYKIMIDERIKNIKIYVDGKSAEIQEVLFSLGAKWAGDDSTELEDYGELFLFLFVDDSGKIRWADSVDNYFHSGNREVKASEVLSWKPKKPEHELKPFDRVLVRNKLDQEWSIEFFEKKSADGTLDFCLTTAWYYCIPYEGNEHLLGTNFSPDDKVIIDSDLKGPRGKSGDVLPHGDEAEPLL